MNKVNDIYNQAIKVSQNLVEDIRFSRGINLETVQACATQICDCLNKNSNIMEILISVQDKNRYLFSHPVDVAFIAYVIGKWMSLKQPELYHLVCAGLLHDIGKAKVKDRILNKPDKLTEQEMEKVRSHSVIGYQILADLNCLDEVILTGVLSHHERLDGTGYPYGLKGEEIGIYGRIIAIADIYDAITSTKAYQAKSTPFKAIEEIQASSFGTLDPRICQVFMNHVIDYTYGSQVRLSNELIGEIIYINPVEKTKPIIRCENEYFNLTVERDIEIVELLYHTTEFV